ncbi:MAG: alginate export family protein [Cyclobacteriaceae bacterium]|nr:alginate export family protein [Cyclobacteriaceae bacterium]
MAQFTLTGEVRPRAEMRNGFKSPHPEGSDPALFIEQRTRLYMNYSLDKIQLNISLQDVRMWGSTSQIYKSDPTLTNLYEAWARYKFNDTFAFTVGRQALDYDNARFMGDLDWAQQGRSHDALLFTRTNSDKGCKLHLALAFNQKIDFEPAKLTGSEYFGVNNYKSMVFVWWNKKFDQGSMSLLFHNDGQQAADTTVASRQTYGALGEFTTGPWKLDGELYYQGGQNKLKTDVSALLLTLHATFKTNVTPLTLGFEYLSGTSLTDDKDYSFNPLYGTNHKFYGYMDYFYVGNSHGQAGNGTTSGLIDIHLKTNFKLSAKSALAANIHHFSSPVAIYEDNSGATSLTTGLGTEIDLVYTATLSKDVKFNLGYSQMFATETLQVIKNVNNASQFNNWVWAMIAFKPQLFTTAKQ